MAKIVFLLVLVFLYACQIPLESPAELRAFSSPATSEEVIRFCQRAAGKSEHLTLHTIGRSETGIPLVAIRVADSHSPAEDPLRIIIFAQQHGNEQSGKEAALLLIRDFAKGKHEAWRKNIETWIVPQLNPDGSDVNQRRNAGGIDLNRDHIVQLASETRAIHALFRSVMPHVTVDIHEYQPFRESWEEFGGYKNFDVQVGVPTNPNVDERIRTFALEQALPAIGEHLNSKGFSFHNYIVGPVPTQGRTRHSTVDFDDGRQSFAILNTLSFIYEGINGRDGFIENLERRTYGQYEALLALMEFLQAHNPKVIDMVELARHNLRHSAHGELVPVRLEHFPDGTPLLLPLTSSTTGEDTLVVVENYHPVVKPTLEVRRPRAYLVPASDSLLVNFLKLHEIEFERMFIISDKNIVAMQINSIEMSNDEELANRLPHVTPQKITLERPDQQYLFVPTAQLHSNFLVSLFEPQSMLGLAQRPGFEYLLEEGGIFPILRVEE